MLKPEKTPPIKNGADIGEQAQLTEEDFLVFEQGRDRHSAPVVMPE